MPDYIPNEWPIWAALALAFVKIFQKELATFLPTAVREHFALRAKLRSDRQEHEQELQEVSVEALAQSSVTAQMQLIQNNKQLIDFLTGQIDNRLQDIERILRDVRDLSREYHANDRVDWSRVIDTLTKTEILLRSLEFGFKGEKSDADETG